MLTAIPEAPPRTIVVVGRESVGKSQLITSLTGVSAGESNFRGSTVRVGRYRKGGREFVDTPGIVRRSDTETTRLALRAIDDEDLVLLVIQATQPDEDLRDLLPLVAGRRGAIVITFWDKVEPDRRADDALQRLAAEIGPTPIPVDARHLSNETIDRLCAALDEPVHFRVATPTERIGWRIEPRPGWLEHRYFGPPLAILLLLLPALATIFGANRLADLLHPRIASGLEPLIESIAASPWRWLRVALVGEQEEFGYGLLSMGPFLLVWALPTVLLFSLVLAVYKSSGLIERINAALHPWCRPFGLAGRDVVRVMMGFGCNVPAVIGTRSCSACSRVAAISAIGFGSACSYQLPATLAVLAASAEANGVDATVLTAIFLGYLLLTTLVYLRLTAGREARSPLNVLMTVRRPFMQWPTLRGLWNEAHGTIRQFLLQALPIFVVICLVASVVAELGGMRLAATVFGPTMRLFDLPADAALPIAFASVRKDGIFLFAADQGLAFPMTAVQTLTATYLAGVLVPCVVTALTAAREVGWSVTARMLLRQACFALLFAMLLGWSGRWFS